MEKTEVFPACFQTQEYQYYRLQRTKTSVDVYTGMCLYVHIYYTMKWKFFYEECPPLPIFMCLQHHKGGQHHQICSQDGVPIALPTNSSFQSGLLAIVIETQISRKKHLENQRRNWFSIWRLRTILPENLAFKWSLIQNSCRGTEHRLLNRHFFLLGKEKGCVVAFRWPSTSLYIWWIFYRL